MQHIAPLMGARILPFQVACRIRLRRTFLVLCSIETVAECPIVLTSLWIETWLQSRVLCDFGSAMHTAPAHLAFVFRCIMRHWWELREQRSTCSVEFVRPRSTNTECYTMHHTIEMWTDVVCWKQCGFPEKVQFSVYLQTTWFRCAAFVLVGCFHRHLHHQLVCNSDCYLVEPA